MSEHRKVTKVEIRIPPDAGKGEPEGYSYTMCADGETRELFVFHDAGAAVDYQLMRFVRREAEGANFYLTPREDRFTYEFVPQSVKDAARDFDEREALGYAFALGNEMRDGKLSFVEAVANLRVYAPHLSEEEAQRLVLQGWADSR